MPNFAVNALTMRSVVGVFAVLLFALLTLLAFAPAIRLGCKVTTAGKWPHAAAVWAVFAVSINVFILAVGGGVFTSIAAQPASPDGVFDDRAFQLGSTLTTSLLWLSLTLLGFRAAWGYLLESLVPLEKAAAPGRDAALQVTTALTWRHLIMASLLWSGTLAVALAGATSIFTQDGSLAYAFGGGGAIIAFFITLLSLRILLRHQMNGSSS